MIEAAPCPFCGGEGIKRYIDAALKNEALDKKEIRQLKAENEKLRELIQDMYTLLTVSMPSSAARDATLARVRKSMAKLGVEQ